MNAAAINQVANHLNVAASAVIKLEEWANVLFAVVKGIGARFVSKKVVKTVEEYSAYYVADTICDLINESNDYTARLWDKKSGETRVYVSTTGKKSKDCGYITVTTGGEIIRNLDRQAGTIESLYESAKALKIKVEIQPEPNSNELAKTARDHMAGYNVNSDAVLAAYKAGHLSMSDAMNSDF